MPDDSTHDGPIKIYEGASLTAKAPIPSSDAEFVEEVTFKFFQDGEPFDPPIEKTVPASEGKTESGSSDAPVVIKYEVRAPVVPDDKDSYLLDYHVFYKVKNEDGTTEQHQNLSIRKFEVLPRTAQLKVTWEKDGEPFHNFQFNVFQGGEQVGQTQTTFAKDTKNSKDETVPAGTAEFNLGLRSGFRIVQEGPFEIAEHITTTTRKRELKGDLKFRAVFIAPKKGTIQQYVNYDVENQGQSGIGHEVLIEVGVDGDDDRAVKIGNENTEINFRVTYGPEEGEAVAKSKREDADHPTKALKANESDTTATIEEKTANTKYEGKVTLPGGIGRFKVGLGKAGGDTCTVEIAGSDKFLTDDSITSDQTLKFENWRRVHYELMVPDTMQDKVLAPARRTPVDTTASTTDTTDDKDSQHTSSDFIPSVGRKLQTLGRELFIELVHDASHVFDAMEKADHGTLAPRKFLNLPGDPDTPIYILSGRNWRNVPEGQTWLDKHPGKTLQIHICDALLKWRTDTEDEQVGTKDFSGTLTEATGFVNMLEKFEGLFMPFSGDDGGEGITDATWSADISKDDDGCKYTPELEIEEARHEAGVSGELLVVLDPDDLPLPAATITFNRSINDDESAYEAELGDAETSKIQSFIDSLLGDRDLLCEVDAKIKIILEGDQDTGHGEDECYTAVKSKLEELFDATKEEFSHHPGLDNEGEPRTETLPLREITAPSTAKEWHFQLPVSSSDGKPGPGAIVGEEKTPDKCPVKIEFAVQPHEASPGESEGRNIAFVWDGSKGANQLLRLILQGLNVREDDACSDHGHGDDGTPGDCLEDSNALCTDCIEHGRSRNLTSL